MQQWPDEIALQRLSTVLHRFGHWLEKPSPTDWLLVIVSSSGVIAALMTLRRIAVQTDANLQSAAAAKISADVARDTFLLNRAKDRAYVSMSHRPPGLQIEAFQGSTSHDPDPGYKNRVGANIKIVNEGNSPATITGHLVQLMFTNEPLPAIPPYDDKLVKIVRIPLVHRSDFSLTPIWNVHASAIDRVRSDDDWSLYVIGFVDYIDMFGGHHRSGYARRWDPFAEHRRRLYLRSESEKVEATPLDDTPNNLLIVTQMAYNYDRLRQPDEGNDWE